MNNRNKDYGSSPDSNGNSSGIFKWTADALFGTKKHASQDDTNNNLNYDNNNAGSTKLHSRPSSWDGSLRDMGLSSSFYKKYDLLSPEKPKTRHTVDDEILLSPIHLKQSFPTYVNDKDPTDTFYRKNRGRANSCLLYTSRCV